MNVTDDRRQTDGFVAYLVTRTYPGNKKLIIKQYINSPVYFTFYCN